MSLPELAISIRQPWAWAIIFAGKPLENRTAAAISHFPTPVARPLAIHAAKGMKRTEYEKAKAFIETLGIAVPPPHALLRGGIIGSVTVTGIVSESDNPWFFGPRALVLANPEPCDFIPAVGQLGYFKWSRADPSIVPEPALWMLPQEAEEKPALDPDMFMGG
jgi:hypothetical protein